MLKTEVMKTVVVESPTKAKTIGKYLGRGYKVIASYGHVRNLVHKDGSVLPEDDFSMKWETESRGNKQLSEIKKAIDTSEELILATDPDREGEAISWHICEILKDKLTDKKVSRIAFHEITKSAILEAIKHPQSVNQSLVEAYLARCALDYLVGFKLSPILWRRLPGSRSAGRVQSVALRLVFDREREIEAFVPKEYWDITATVTPEGKRQFTSKLIKLNSKKLGKFDLNDEKKARKALEQVSGLKYQVASVEEKDQKRSPAPPFITSTMQQEAARKLGFSARKTMQIAQKLYEGIEIDGQPVGLITYMRTDSTIVSDQALTAVRGLILESFGEDYLPGKPNVYSKKVRNAQEAHEAIRPTNFDLPPEKLSGVLDKDMLNLYSLIWKRAVSSQMSHAIIAQVSVDLADESGNNVFHATGSSIKFDGFLKLYEESFDDKEQEDSEMLPKLSVGEDVVLSDYLPTQHFTQAPSRYSEASLVKKLEELGIGRPSTYANIIYVLQDRDYISLKKKRFFLEDRGRLVTIFLMKYFSKYVEYNFTADMEQDLDDISNEKKGRLEVLRNFWNGFNSTLKEAEKLKITDVIAVIEKDMEDLLFPGENGKKCPECDGKLGLRLGKYGAFVACSNYPECKYTKKIVTNNENDGNIKSGEQMLEPKVVGVSEKFGGDLLLKKGPYGFYIEAKVDGQVKRSSVPKFLNVDNITGDIAEFLISLPKDLGVHPESGEKVLIGIGKFGPYVKCGNKFFSVKDFEEFINLDLDGAVKKVVAKKEKQ